MTKIVKRTPNWRLDLISYLEASARRPFRHGTHDCALFLAGGVLAMTGVDFAAPYRGRYTTQRGGFRVLKADGYADHIALARAKLSEKPVAFAREGDGAIIPGALVDALGIVQGSMIYVLRENGLACVPLTAASRVLEV